MTKQDLITKVEKQFRLAKNEEAIEALEAWLRPQKKYEKLHEIALNLQAKWAKFKADETSGILSFEQKELTVNRLRKEILELVRNIEQDNLNPITKTKKTNWALIAMVGFGIILAGIAYFLVQNTGEEDSKDSPQIGLVCPDCTSDSLFKIFILPFYNPAGDKLRPQGSIRERLNDLSEEEGLETCVGIYKDFEPDSYLSKSEAAEKGKNCNAEIIVWGRAENTLEGKLIKTGFQFLGEKAGLEFEELHWENEVKKLKTISEIASGGELTNDLEALIALIFGLRLEEKGEFDKAIAKYESIKISPKDSAAHLMKNMRTADWQIKKGDETAAIAALDTVLNAHPNYWLALNNRAVLNMKTENYLDAADDFSSLLNIRKKDTLVVLESRGTAYLKAEQLKNAEKDFEEVLKMQPEKREVRKKLEETKTEIKKQEIILDKANQDIQKNPRNVSAYRKKAEAARKLGQYEVAEENLRIAQRIRPRNTEVYVARLELAAAKGDSENAQTIIKEAENQGVNTRRLLNEKGVSKILKNRRMNLNLSDRQ